MILSDKQKRVSLIVQISVTSFNKKKSSYNYHAKMSHLLLLNKIVSCIKYLIYKFSLTVCHK